MLVTGGYEPQVEGEARQSVSVFHSAPELIREVVMLMCGFR